MSSIFIRIYVYNKNGWSRWTVSTDFYLFALFIYSSRPMMRGPFFSGLSSFSTFFLARVTFQNHGASYSTLMKFSDSMRATTDANFSDVRLKLMKKNKSCYRLHPHHFVVELLKTDNRRPKRVLMVFHSFLGRRMERKLFKLRYFNIDVQDFSIKFHHLMT